MGRYEAFTSTLFRTDSYGRTVYVPKLHDDVYLVRDDAEAARIAHEVYRIRKNTIYGVVIILLLTTDTRPWFSLGLFAVAAWSARERRDLRASLEKSTERAGDLPPLDRRARRAAWSTAMGRRHFWDQVAASVVIALIAIGGFFGSRAEFARTHDESEVRRMMIIGALMLAFCAYSLVSAIIALRSIPPDPGTTVIAA